MLLTSRSESFVYSTWIRKFSSNAQDDTWWYNFPHPASETMPDQKAESSVRKKSIHSDCIEEVVTVYCGHTIFFIDYSFTWQNVFVLMLYYRTVLFIVYTRMDKNRHFIYAWYPLMRRCDEKFNETVDKTMYFQKFYSKISIHLYPKANYIKWRFLSLRV